MTEINNRIAVQKEAGRVFSLHGHLPVFQHEEQDVRSMFTSQMIAGGTVKPKEIVRTFSDRCSLRPETRGGRDIPLLRGKARAEAGDAAVWVAAEAVVVVEVAAWGLQGRKPENRPLHLAEDR